MRVSSLHIGAAVFLDEAEPGLFWVIRAWSGRRAPPGDHQLPGRGGTHGDAPPKDLPIGPPGVLPVTGREPDRGPWEPVCYDEFDGKRGKRVGGEGIGERPHPSNISL